jgi:N-acetylmuramoyl-L-alanine amidase
VGIYEKQMTLAIVLILKEALEREGVHVLTTRTTDKFVANEDRLSYYRGMNPDLLLSIHLNSSVNPVDIKGTATYYKYPFCQPLNYALHQRMLELGLGDFGNNANFNFVLNQPTEFPDALIETLFLSNPEDEMHVLDEGYRHEIANKIVLGLKDFLQQAGK